MKGKTTNSLMMHIRDNHGIDINGSLEKRKLLEMGYYHGYKAYKYKGKTTNKLGYTTFNQIVSVYTFDNDMKRLLYPYAMKLETILKNIVIDCLVSNSEITFERIYDTKLNRANELSPKAKSFPDKRSRQRAEKSFRKATQNKLRLKQEFDRAISNYYGKKDIVEHFVHSGKPIPLWAHFELVTLGSFGSFLSCLCAADKVKISKAVGTYNTAVDRDGILLEKHIFIFKELRNAVAHNSVIFDTRFRTISVSGVIKNQLSQEFSISNIDFTTILDYVILLLHYLKPLGFSKTELKRLVRDIERSIKDFETSLNNNTILFSILGSNYKNKLLKINSFL
ncbi:Abi family protein [Lactococcus lactis]|uniref:Abi family protein n=1 Tax=Lactococcus lactis TaxID=1358 RepID=A0AAP8JDF9_9LACT|nr:Abi family protein [Lactococcus lactis]MDG4972343.1 Abi family protein [Lactococcus lactis]PFG88487.1 hypothetical protein BW154_03055 [Lactococcus lactis]